jgi:hypothetical protein
MYAQVLGQVKNSCIIVLGFIIFSYPVLAKVGFVYLCYSLLHQKKSITP